MEPRHPLLRAASLALPSALLIGACILYAFRASQGVPNGEFREVPSPVARAAEANRIGLTHLKRLELPNSALRLNGEGPVLFAALTTSGLAAIDITDPYDPEIRSHLRVEADEPPSRAKRPEPRQAKEYVLNAYLVGERLIVLDRLRGLVAYDAADPFHPTFLWSKLLPGNPSHQATDLEEVGDSLFLASGGAGLLQLETGFGPETAARPILERFDHTTDATFLPPNWMLVTDGRNSGLQIIDVSGGRPASPVGNVVCWPLFLENAVIIGRHAFLTTRGDNVVLAFNLADPARPYLSTVYRKPISSIRSVTTWRDRYVIIGNRFGFIEILDAADPEHPGLVALLPIPGIVSALFVREDALYAGLWGEALIEVYRLGEVDAAGAPGPPTPRV